MITIDQKNSIVLKIVANFMSNFCQLDFLDKLTEYHRLFYGVFELGNPIFTEEIDTAGVAFNKETGKIDFLLNEDFFTSLNSKEQLFLVCHEALHVVFAHIERTKIYKLDLDLSNIAQDIVINELLVNEFGFNRGELPFTKDGCFVDTVFTASEIQKYDIKTNGSFEYYYSLLEKKNKKSLKVKNIDIHDLEKVLSEIYSQIPEEVSDNIMRVVAEKMANEEAKDMLKALSEPLSDKLDSNGTTSLGSHYGIVIEKLNKKVKWEDIVKKKVASLLKVDNREYETFVKRPRRLTCLDEDLFLPEYTDFEHVLNDKFNIAFFLDSSGSCIGYKNQFFSLAASIPKDKFNVTLYSFDTRVYKLDIKSKSVQGGGGTSFQPMENTIQNGIKNDPDYRGKYPDLVFVLTDGYGDTIRPALPKNWYWLMTEDYTSYVPKGSNYLMLNSFKNGVNKIMVA